MKTLLRAVLACGAAFGAGFIIVSVRNRGTRRGAIEATDDSGDQPGGATRDGTRSRRPEVDRGARRERLRAGVIHIARSLIHALPWTVVVMMVVLLILLLSPQSPPSRFIGRLREQLWSGWIGMSADSATAPTNATIPQIGAGSSAGGPGQSLQTYLPGERATVSINPRKIGSESPVLLAAMSLEVPERIRQRVFDRVNGRFVADPGNLVQGKPLLRSEYRDHVMLVRMVFSWGKSERTFPVPLGRVYDSHPGQSILVDDVETPVPVCGSLRPYPNDFYVFSADATITLRSPLLLVIPTDPSGDSGMAVEIPSGVRVDETSNSGAIFVSQDSRTMTSDELTQLLQITCPGFLGNVSISPQNDRSITVARSLTRVLMNYLPIVVILLIELLLAIFLLLPDKHAWINTQFLITFSAFVVAGIQIRETLQPGESDVSTDADVLFVLTVVGLFLLFALRLRIVLLARVSGSRHAPNSPDL